MEISMGDQFVEVPGGRVFVRTWTPAVAANSLPLVLLHDSLGCVSLWRDFPQMLATQLTCPVVAYDRLGFGRSSERHGLPSVNFIREEVERFLPIVLSELGISDFTLFGHSVGGVMALVAASRAGERCQAVITESAQAFVEDRTIAGIEAAREQFQRPEEFNRLKKWHDTNAQWVLDAWIKIWLSPEFASWSLEPDLPRVRCPVLIIHGNQDEYGSVEFPHRISRLVGGPSEVLILEGCGHVPRRERQSEVLDRISAFLKRLPPFPVADLTTSRFPAISLTLPQAENPFPS